MMDDVLDADEDVEDAADEEIDKVLEEITMGVKSARVVKEDLPQEQKEDMTDLQARLGALKS